MKKHSILKQIAALFVLCILFVGLIPINTHASEGNFNTKVRKPQKFDLKVAMTREDRVRIRLNQPGVAKYVIYRADANADGTLAASYKRITKIHGADVTCIDKIEPGNYYFYKVYGYQKINGKNQRVYVGKELVYGGGYTMWDEYQHCDAKVTPEEIPLKLNTEEDFIPAGYVIYRKTEGFKYEKIAKIETTEQYIEYVDRTVETGKTYFYKARAYRYINGKKVFSIYTNRVQLSAVNQIGTFEYEVLTPVNEQTNELVMKLSSDANNGELVFTTDTNWNSLCYYSLDGYKGEEFDVSCALTEYSYDNQSWTELMEENENLVLEAGETIYLKFRGRENQKFVYLGKEAMKDTRMIYEEVRYNNLISALWFDADSAKARLVGEYYH